MAELTTTNALNTDSTVSILNDETHQCLRVAGHWTKDVAGLSGGKIYLRLYITGLAVADPRSVEAVGAGYRLKGVAQKEFEEARSKLMNLGIISDPSHAEAVITKTPRQRDDRSDCSSYEAYIAVDPINIHLERLQDLRRKADRAFESLKLMDGVFDLEDAEVAVCAPESPDGKLSIVYAGMTPDMFHTVLDTPLMKGVGEKIEAKMGIYQGLPKNFPEALAPSVVGGVPMRTYGTMVIDGEDPALKERLLRFSITKNLQALALEEPGMARRLLDDLDNMIRSGHKQLPGSSRDHPRIGGRKDNPRIADIPSSDLPE